MTSSDPNTPLVLNSRPADYRARFHAAFAAVLPAWRIVDSPVIVPEPVGAALPSPATVDLLIFTSQTAAALFPDVAPWRSVKVFAVGEATADAARTVGFSDVTEAGRDVSDLRRGLAGADFRAALYPSGEEVTADLAREFPGRISRAVIYRMAAQTRLSAAFLASGWTKVPVIAPLFSRHSAVVLADLLEKAILENGGVKAGARSDIAAVGISAEALADGPWRIRAVADEPTLASVAQAARRVADQVNGSSQ